jgi:hypothetical protein
MAKTYLGGGTLVPTSWMSREADKDLKKTSAQRVPSWEAENIVREIRAPLLRKQKIGVRRHKSKVVGDLDDRRQQWEDAFREFVRWADPNTQNGHTRTLRTMERIEATFEPKEANERLLRRTDAFAEIKRTRRS